MKSTISRRSFIKVSAIAGSGMLLSFSFLRANNDNDEAEEVTFSPNAYIKINGDNTIVLMAPNPEIGQGVKTSLPLIIAEELGVDWENIKVELAPLNSDFGRQTAGGSGSVKGRFTPLREAGAIAREMLTLAAAQQWNVPVAECVAENGAVTHTGSGKKLSYGNLAATAAKLEVPEAPKLKAAKDYKYIGKRIMDVDAKAITKGQPLYGIDTRKDGMLFAMVARPPAYGKGLVKVIDDAALKINGVKKVITLENAVAVLATSTWAAKKGREALDITWEAKEPLENTADHIKDFENKLNESTQDYARNDGDFDASLKKAAKVLEAKYLVQTLSHAQLEPLNFYADVSGDKAELYGPTQRPGNVRDEVSKLLGIAPENITVGVPRQGGGFGRKLMIDNAVEAALISHKAQAPVQVQWTREDDMQNDFYRPLAMYHYRAAISKSDILGWYQSAIGIGPGMRGDSYVAGILNNYRSIGLGYESNTPVGWWRAPGANSLAFPAESFLDELCIALKKDPVNYRIQLFEQAKANPIGKLSYDPEKYLSVIKLVAKSADWGKSSAGVYRGFATWYSFGSYAAQVIDIVLENGMPRVSKVYCAVHCGTVINRSGAENQVQGAIIDGICHAMFPKVTFVNGEVQEINFHLYNFLRMKDAPFDIDVQFVESEEPPTGLGEPALPPVAGALANAIYAATGKRIRKLPLMDYFEA
ncbi:molybdopterin cofactor-binding domain-containing protein [Formosa sp. S-31]|uniref:xanthine dehydrogenase family protein molybdopterin-binding subunit n=1 Tax=Formosa sp. S-31 TaxID=2790949 RepID=UPI003EBAF870